MATYNRFEDLKAWRESRFLNKEVYFVLSPRTDKNSGVLINHLFKTYGSIMDNIAEGFEREGNRELRQFLSISKGSAGELRSQLYRALDIEIINDQEFQSLYKQTESICQQLHNFIRNLNNTNVRGNKFK
ncbi:MAG TPA: four helix bundle protein [Crocinitomicaceae bacterium]|nr:four helix bundle protein [Crocinitomicaceae bacterium]